MPQVSLMFGISDNLKINNKAIDWKQVWRNISLSSRNHSSQLLDWKIIHGYYSSPRKQLQMTSSTFCTLCPQKSSATSVHMFWECPEVLSFWAEISKPHIITFSTACLCSTTQRQSFHELSKSFFSGLIAAKTMLVIRWKSPHVLKLNEWLFLCIVNFI